MDADPIDRVIALRVDPAVIAICNGELAPRARIIAARDANAACRLIAAGSSVIVVGRSTPFWDLHVIRDHAERFRLPLLSVRADTVPFELVREVEAAIASIRRRSPGLARTTSGGPPPSSRARGAG
jgi:hypothetical protein